MKISYDLNEDKLLAIQKYWLKRRSLLYQRAVFAVALLFSFFLVMSLKQDQSYLIILANQSLTFIVNLALTYLIIIVLIILYRLSYLKRTRKESISESPLLGINRLEILNDKMILETESIRVEYLISDIKRVLVEQKYAIISFGKERAITIPRNTENLDRFIETLREK